MYNYCSSNNIITMNEEEGMLELNKLLEEVSDVATQKISGDEKVLKAADVVGRANCVVRDNFGRKGCNDVMTLDFNVIQHAASIISNEIEIKESTTRIYNHEQFARCIKNEVDSSAKKWLSLFDFRMLGRGVIPMSPSMFQTFNTDIRPPEVRQRQKRQKNVMENEEPLTQPESIEKSEQMEETSAVLKKIEKIIQRAYVANDKKPLNYFEVVIDPNDFGRTVDNIFQVSFLIRDHTVTVFFEENNLWLRPMTRSETENSKDTEPKQHVINIDMRKWEALKNKFNIKKAMIDIPNRYHGVANTKANDSKLSP